MLGTNDFDDKELLHNGELDHRLYQTPSDRYTVPFKTTFSPLWKQLEKQIAERGWTYNDRWIWFAKDSQSIALCYQMVPPSVEPPKELAFWFIVFHANTYKKTPAKTGIYIGCQHPVTEQQLGNKWGKVMRCKVAHDEGALKCPMIVEWYPWYKRHRQKLWQLPKAVGKALDEYQVRIPALLPWIRKCRQTEVNDERLLDNMFGQGIRDGILPCKAFKAMWYLHEQLKDKYTEGYKFKSVWNLLRAYGIVCYRQYGKLLKLRQMDRFRQLVVQKVEGE